MCRAGEGGGETEESSYGKADKAREDSNCRFVNCGQ